MQKLVLLQISNKEALIEHVGVGNGIEPRIDKRIATVPVLELFEVNEWGLKPNTVQGFYSSFVSFCLQLIN